MKRESGEAFWYAQRVVDVERFRRSHCRCLLPSPPLRFPLCLSLSLSVYLSVCLSVCLSVLVVRRTWLLASLGCLPPLRVQYVQSTLCQLFIFFPLVSFCLSPLSTLFSFFFSFFFFFLISAWRLLFDGVCWAKACRWGFKQGGELWLSPFRVHFEVLDVVCFTWLQYFNIADRLQCQYFVNFDQFCWKMISLKNPNRLGFT